MRTKLILTLALLLAAGTGRAQLTATVQPGYQFAPGERPTIDTLNLLGSPTISIAGTVSGTVGLAAKTVTGTHLADSVVDGSTLDWSGATPRGAKVKDNGITATQIAPAALGAGLYGGNGTAVAVNPDKVGITTNAAGAIALKGGGVYPTNVAFVQWPASNTVYVLDLAKGWTHGLTLGANTSITLSNAVDGQAILIGLIQDATGSHTVTWAAAAGTSIQWRGGAAPTLSTTAWHTDLIQFVRLGNVYYGTFALNYY